jgi:acetyltransferase-like isoleucine patch superfamily enzyme
MTEVSERWGSGTVRRRQEARLMADHTPESTIPQALGRSEPGSSPSPAQRDGRWRLRLRVTWAVTSIILTESVILGLSVLPAVSFWTWVYHWRMIPEWAQVLTMAMAFVPAYVLFATSVLLYSALVTRLFGWRTRPGLALPLAEMSWPVLDWGRYLMTIHVARTFAGPVFRSTPVWTLYLRLNGATIGRGCWVNSLKLMDHSLLEFGDRVTIGSDASVSGHLIEHGVLKTAPVRLGRHVTVGINSVVGIGTTVGDNTQVGALSVVPKHSRLDANAVYAGAPVRCVKRNGVRLNDAESDDVA